MLFCISSSTRKLRYTTVELAIHPYINVFDDIIPICLNEMDQSLFLSRTFMKHQATQPVSLPPKVRVRYYTLCLFHCLRSNFVAFISEKELQLISIIITRNRRLFSKDSFIVLNSIFSIKKQNNCTIDLISKTNRNNTLS